MEADWVVVWSWRSNVMGKSLNNFLVLVPEMRQTIDVTGCGGVGENSLV